ncbi:Uncharacterized conserved protein, DUF58 family, contains vWF domain [Tessaracoccus bendigoensis DSM 12906]|uniref:Uncharacterized conserved protein, DUF58 family, contains vWF domain n=1 Tax=Tessaracoccus bendigoensis DSM 12906 TaxID=1123357 RepID=A0A1M6J3I8_9ACTN|nr:DUF58 domain-containing protein [Tessaracoccus bendigoensis]SHJ41111.1 Uncharacterized conserved protein, DUF58 family, contains vWF domain [Tessaracoccus bendigoensis DSM 12906]
MTLTTEPRWEAPEAVDPPTTQGLSNAYRRLREATGIRTAGWFTLLGGALSLVVGLVFGWLEFTVVGVLAIVTLAISLLFTVGKPRLEVWIQLTGRSVVVGERASGLLHVRNASTRRHWGSRLDLPIGPASASFSLPALLPGATTADEFRLPTGRRGLIVVGPARSVQGDPFSLTGRETHWTGELELYVHPRTVPLPGRQTGFVHDLEGHASPHLSSSDMNFHALRPYVAGDDRRHVHWRSTARTGRLMVRQFEESRMSRVAVSLDTGRTAYLDEEEFELGVCIAASVALQALYAESPLALLTSRETLVSVTPTRTLDELSVVEQTSRGGIADLVHSTIQRAPASSIVILVTGSSTTLTDVRRACSRFDVDARVIGIRVATHEELRVRTAGNITAVQVGRLEDLARAMRKAME